MTTINYKTEEDRQMALRLFTLRYRHNGPQVVDENDKPFYFRYKQDAKRVRDAHGKTSVVVSPGPDHRLAFGDYL